MPHTQPQGFLALPPAGKGRGVLVLHAWWGLNETIKAFCTRLAGSGFIAFAPDLYHGKLATTIPQAEGLSNALDAAGARSDISEAVDFLSQRVAPGGQDLAVIGFSLGAFFALELSNTDPDHIRSVVVFYGTGPEDSPLPGLSTSVTLQDRTNLNRKLASTTWSGYYALWVARSHSIATPAQGTGSSNPIKCRLSMRRLPTWRGTEPWLS